MNELGTRYKETKDFPLACSAIASGLPLLTVRSDSGTCFFCFDNKKSLFDKLQSDFLNGNLTVNVDKFLNAQNKLRDLMRRELGDHP